MTDLDMTIDETSRGSNPAPNYFVNLEQPPENHIFKLLQQYRVDTNPNKIDLGIGVYRDDEGLSPVLSTIKDAEYLRWQEECDKSYIGPAGDHEYCDSVERLIWGKAFLAHSAERVTTMQTPGASSALRMSFDLIASINPEATVWLSDPTWDAHTRFISNELKVSYYPYYDRLNHGVDFDRLIETLSGAVAGDVVLLQGCCHNPTGCDLNLEQWEEIASLCEAKGLLPLVDMAYHGLGDGLQEDRAGLLAVAARVSEVIVTYSCSKNFGLYRDRVGAISVIANDQSNGIEQHLAHIAGGTYFTPPAHGGFLVKNILRNDTLRESWVNEVSGIRNRLIDIRQSLHAKFQSVGIDMDIEYLTTQKGMFSLLDFSLPELDHLRNRYGIYIVNSGRFNLAGLNHGNLDYFVESIASTKSELSVCA